MSLIQDRAVGLLTYLDDPLLEVFTGALLAPADRLSIVSHGDGDTLGPWQGLTDPVLAELWALPYACQYTGGVLPVRRAGETESEYLIRARAEANHPRGMLRGSVDAIMVIARAFLTGTQTCRVIEAVAGELFDILVVCKAGEIIDEDALITALNEPDVLAAGFKIGVQTDDSPMIDEGEITIDSTGGTVTIDSATLDDVT